MSLGIPVANKQKDDYDLTLYANVSVGYYIVKRYNDPSRDRVVSLTIKDYSEALDRYTSLVKIDDAFDTIKEALDTFNLREYVEANMFLNKPLLRDVKDKIKELL